MRLQLRFCPTGVMAADGLTKLASAQVMEDLRRILAGKPFAIPTAAAEFQFKNSVVAASATLATQTSYGWLPMIERRRRADQLALQFVSADKPISDAQLHKVLDLWGFARNTKRRNVAPPGMDYVFSECFGLVYDRTGRWMVSAVAQLFPSVARFLNRWFVHRLAQLSHRAFPAPLGASCTCTPPYKSFIANFALANLPVPMPL